MDFLLLAMNQLVNIAAKSRYMYGGAVSVPLVVRSIIGKSWGQGAQHSQGLHALFMHVPGLKVVAPTTPYDAKGCLVQAIRDDNPVMFVEHRLLHGIKGPRARGAVHGAVRARARARRGRRRHAGRHLVHAGGVPPGADATWSARASRAEVIDPISLTPLDMDTIEVSLRKTGRLLVVDTAWTSCGAAAEIVAQAVERLQGAREIRIRRLGFAPVPCPTTRPLEDLFYPNPRRIAAAGYALVDDKPELWEPEDDDAAADTVEFKGPF